ncbi:DMT family transporter [Pseudogracilibacillus sp. ICA-222130]|uniref:DMT family transporter n=1 Tax=Pseudogracilibacillus sp. ICA-222130 TaxID=3134655 RepID=UPI0030BC7A26
MKRYVGDVMLLITAFVWGSGFVVTAIALQYLTAYQVMAGRFILATFLLIIIFGYKFKNFNLSIVWRGMILGIILYISFALQTVGLEYTTPSKNAFITAVNVVVVPIIAFFAFRRAIDRQEIIASILALVGIGFLSLQGSFTINFGDFLTLLCAIGFAFDIFFTNVFVQKEDALSLTIVQFMTASCIGAIVLLFQGDLTVTMEKEGWYAIIYLAIFSTTIAYVCQNWAFQYTTATRAAIILSTEALFGTIMSVLILHEVLSGRMIFGAVLIMSAILIAELKPFLYLKKRKDARKRIVS